MPNYRVVEIHGPNKMVVRDEKGIKSVRRSSHLKVCELKDKVAAMLPVYRDKGTPPKKGAGSSFTVTKLPSSLEPKGQKPLSLPHSP